MEFTDTKQESRTFQMIHNHMMLFQWVTVMNFCMKRKCHFIQNTCSGWVWD